MFNIIINEYAQSEFSPAWTYYRSISFRRFLVLLVGSSPDGTRFEIQRNWKSNTRKYKWIWDTRMLFKWNIKLVQFSTVFQSSRVWVGTKKPSKFDSKGKLANFELKMQLNIEYVYVQCTTIIEYIFNEFSIWSFTSSVGMVGLQKTWVFSVNSNEIHSIVSNNLTLLSLEQFSFLIFIYFFRLKWKWNFFSPFAFIIFQIGTRSVEYG